MYSSDDFRADFDVSRETMEKFHIYEALLKKWTKKINLVAPSTVNDIWWRHFADSAQIVNHVPMRCRTWVDLGSGAGFPGLVSAILLQEAGIDFHLVESDQRKASFLRTVSRETSIKTQIHAKRIEDIDIPNADVVSARALANLEQLLSYSEPFTTKNSVFLLLKGKTWQEELANAQKLWQMEVNNIESLTENEARLLEITSVERG